jgi:hypothetical protein
VFEPRTELHAVINPIGVDARAIIRDHNPLNCIGAAEEPDEHMAGTGVDRVVNKIR